MDSLAWDHAAASRRKRTRGVAWSPGSGVSKKNHTARDVGILIPIFLLIVPKGHSRVGPVPQSRSFVIHPVFLLCSFLLLGIDGSRTPSLSTVGGPPGPSGALFTPTTSTFLCLPRHPDTRVPGPPVASSGSDLQFSFLSRDSLLDPSRSGPTQEPSRASSETTPGKCDPFTWSRVVFF